MNSKEVLVSINCVTYNHIRYIRECLDSLLHQKTNFLFEILIHDDASSDGTVEIIKEYQKKYPDIIKPIYQLVNQYSNGGKISLEYQFPRALGKYIAMCEGDDYWLDPYKLQKQVDFMELNPDYSIVYHKVNIFEEASKSFQPEENNKIYTEETYTIKDLAIKNFIHTPSVLFRATALDFTILNQNKDVFIDYFLWMICAKSGKIKYFPDIMAVYRVSDGSVWALKDVKIRLFTWIHLLITLMKVFSTDTEVSNILFTQMKSTYNNLFFEKKEFDDQKKFDLITKKLLLEIKDFQLWWFTYMGHVKSSRMYRLKFYFYLLINNSLSSTSLMKKCLYK